MGKDTAPGQLKKSKQDIASDIQSQSSAAGAIGAAVDGICCQAQELIDTAQASLDNLKRDKGELVAAVVAKLGK